MFDSSSIILHYSTLLGLPQNVWQAPALQLHFQLKLSVVDNSPFPAIATVQSVKPRFFLLKTIHRSFCTVTRYVDNFGQVVKASSKACCSFTAIVIGFSTFTRASSSKVPNVAILHCEEATRQRSRGAYGLLLQECHTTSARIYFSKDPDPTIHHTFTFASRLQEQTFHLQVLTCDNLPTQAKPRGSSMIPTYHCFGTLFATHGLIIYTYTELMSALWFDGRLLEQEDPSPTVDVQQFTTRFGQNHKFDGRLLEREDPSPKVDVQQFTRFGLNHKIEKDPSPRVPAQQFTRCGKITEYDGPSRRVHSQQFTRFGGKIKGTSTILTYQFFGSLLTTHELIIYTNTKLIPTL
eukprot:scaffold6195_cov60-Cylindrotheca_fusiformis.AAC.1